MPVTLNTETLNCPQASLSVLALRPATVPAALQHQGPGPTPSQAGTAGVIKRPGSVHDRDFFLHLPVTVYYYY
eukprot:1326722-Rhodomonas_salina.1